MIKVGEQIRAIRLRRGYNQEQLAEMASLNRVTIAKYESGKDLHGRVFIQFVGKSFAFRIISKTDTLKAIRKNRARSTKEKPRKHNVCGAFVIFSGW